MNIINYFKGSVQALKQSDGWNRFFDLNGLGFIISCIAAIITVPLYYVGALATQKERVANLGAEKAGVLPEQAFFVIASLYVLAFLLTALLLSQIFGKKDKFLPWVIVRNWAVFFVALFSAIIFGLCLAGILPYMWASNIVLVLYLGTLAIDILLARKIAGFEWFGAIITGCLIVGLGLAIIARGVAPFIQG